MAKGVILFDFDGTLIDSSKAITHFFFKAVRELYPEEIAFQDENIDAAELNQGFNQILEKRGLSLGYAQLMELVYLYRSFYHQEPIRQTVIYPLVKKLLKNLKKQGFLLAIVTGKELELAKKTILKLKLAPYFHWIQGKEEDLKPKPQKDILVRAIENLPSNNGPFVMIGDSYVDILAGKKIGAKTIGVSYGFSPHHELEAFKPDKIVNQTGELQQAIKELVEC